MSRIIFDDYTIQKGFPDIVNRNVLVERFLVSMERQGDLLAPYCSFDSLNICLHITPRTGLAARPPA